MSLEKYRKKRNFSVSPEPSGKILPIAKAKEPLLYVIQKHRASLDRVAKELLEKETLDKDELAALLVGVEPDSQNSETVGTVRIVAAD